MEHTCCYTRGAEWSLKRFYCSRKAKIERNGKWYCGTHDPVAVKARLDKRYEEYRLVRAAKMEEVAVERSRRDVRDQALNALYEIAAGHNDPVSLARRIIADDPDNAEVA